MKKYYKWYTSDTNISNPSRIISCGIVKFLRSVTETITLNDRYKQGSYLTYTSYIFIIF